jgi:hypothetical protein
VGCNEYTANLQSSCALDAPGRYVGLVHASGEHTGFAVELESVDADGTLRLTIHADDESEGLVNPEEEPEPTACGCAAPGTRLPALLPILAIVAAAGVRRRGR